MVHISKFTSYRVLVERNDIYVKKEIAASLIKKR